MDLTLRPDRLQQQGEPQPPAEAKINYRLWRLGDYGIRCSRDDTSIAAVEQPPDHGSDPAMGMPQLSREQLPSGVQEHHPRRLELRSGN